MTELILTCGIPASGKSTWARSWVGEDPLNRVRVNKDHMRNMANGSVFSKEHETVINSAQRVMIQSALLAGKSVVNDNTNIGMRYWNEAVKMVKGLNLDCIISERVFYIELDEALARDNERTGAARVGEEVIRRFWAESGKEAFKGYQAKSETFVKRPNAEAPKHDPKLPDCVVIDVDGTVALLNGRNPYDASTADQDLPNTPVIETVRTFYNAGYDVIFCSGREDKYREPTERFIQQHLPEVRYQLLMRKTSDQRPDQDIKEELYRANIEGQYNVLAVYDDRSKVVKRWRALGLPCFQVNEGDF